ncbi:hypothetical protein LJU02_04505 [Corynebacterium pseudotuberculosis]|nr:hypothetical protein [Corynebacterium pseudotuberculosis]AKP08542.1 Hypothetical protein Cp262_0877 [Corynebacterium pseudotuberculosis]AKS13225.1 Hypothetical protein CpE19_0886 [Corynebacterium pseudotuberculosis]APG81453.1 hypothetical protein CPI37_0778 [Corynebacterium pseudotuberculosis]ATB61828.1 Hypothetical protein BFF96_0943 [Corynebacterium pseudotuberculosis]AUY60327.1 Hypothetical protein BFG00_0939 [Corynebacterium pseudotuberculosis]
MAFLLLGVGRPLFLLRWGSERHTDDEHKLGEHGSSILNEPLMETMN